MRRLAVGLYLAVALSTAVQAAEPSEGKQLYDRHCGMCHGLHLRGSAHGAELSGAVFAERWLTGGIDALIAYNATAMPPGGAGKLSPVVHASIARYLFAANGVEVELEPESEGGEAVAAGQSAFDSWSEAGSIDAIARSRSSFDNKTIDEFEPVSQAMLNNPAPGDWLSWRRTLDGHGHSPLKEITGRNVEKLKLAWSIAMHDGSNQVTPLVYDGVMYLTHPGNIVQALDARTGELIWEYAYPYPPESKTLGGPTRNIAIYGDKVFLATYDAALIALDARTGALKWLTVKADFHEGYTHTAGPIVGGGVVLSGINGCERYKDGGCFLTGHDPDTGRELWRTQTVAQPGQPGGDTWGDTPAHFRAGGDTWIAGSYDVEQQLFIIGTSQAKPWVAASRGMATTDAALYTNSTLAIDPKTGAIVWHFQHIPGETIDMEVGFERVLVQAGERRYVYTVGKAGILWKLDAADGKFIAHAETMPQNVFSNIDPTTGRVTYRADIAAAKVGEAFNACPGIYGGHNWQAMAYAPDHNRLVIPLHQLCADMVGRPVPRTEGGGGYGGDSNSYAMPGSNGQLGKLVAYDADSLQPAWTHTQRAMFMTGALTTGGGLAFIGDLDRYFKAFDMRNGKEVWRTRLPAPTHGYPISYAVDGEQFVAVPTGMGVFRAMTAVISPDIYQPTNGQALYVFSLGPR